MIDGTYGIRIETPFGSGPGTVELRSDGDKAIIKINVPVLGRQRAEGKLEGQNAFSAKGSFFLLLLGVIKYKLHGEVEGDSLHVTIKSSRGNLELTGTRK